jgi:glycosyltransferase involved in cell wall biosynthesis
MRIVQIIDSLEVGGAEKMAVNYANSLSEKVSFSGIIATRKQGDLYNQIENKENYFFLNRKGLLDIGSVFRLKTYLKKNKIDFIHAHGTSFFIAFCSKIFFPKVKIIWHDHNGARPSQNWNQNKLLLFCSIFFSGIIVVNHDLALWCKKVLKFKKVLYLPNFISNNIHQEKQTLLKGEAGKKILCLANLRNPKNHNLLVNIAIKTFEKYPDWSFHLVGKDSSDDYSKQLKEKILLNNLSNNVFIYGLKTDTFHIINQATICVLTSTSEGLPVALLEYGMQEKPVLSTDVGQIPMIIYDEKNGYIVSVTDEKLFYKRLEMLIESPSIRANFGAELNNNILENYSEKFVLKKYLYWINLL